MPEAANQEEVFAAHSAWVAGLRAQYEAATSRSRPVGGGVQPSGFGDSGDFGMAGGELQLHMAGEPQLHEAQQLDERFDEALDFEEPVYRSLSDVSWQPANDELDFDSDAPVYRSLGGLLGGAEMQAEDALDAHATWMQSMPPLVQRQKAFRS